MSQKISEPSQWLTFILRSSHFPNRCSVIENRRIARLSQQISGVDTMALADLI